MKKVLSVVTLAFLFVVAASARTQSNNLATAGNDNGKVEGDKGAKSSSNSNSDSKRDKKQEKPAPPSTATAPPIASDNSNSATTDAPPKTVSTVPNGTPAKTDDSIAKTTLQSLANIYRVGVGDILDIRLLNATSRESTLFTVMAGGLLDYPLAGEPVSVAGLTTDEIKQQLVSKIKVYDDPKVAVSVREYASHTVIISGLVNEPGTKVLRREAMPLYVVLAEAQPKPEAGSATIVHADRQTVTVNLSDQKAMTTFVLPGDVITLVPAPPAPPQFFYIGGQISSPGQKDFHAGMTLTQAVLASGGTTRFASSKVKISRQGADGRLITTEYNLKQIEAGKIPDPELQPGDRIDVGRSGW